jgi:coproporphyrinogen III oxidase
MHPTIGQEEIITYLKHLRETLIAAFERFEPSHRFIRTPWNYEQGIGGGEMGVLRGEVFEKAAVNWSGVGGEKFPMRDGSGPFFATGVSLITHMHNPFAPTVHFNIRYIETEQERWLAGGYDLTPMGLPQEEDTLHFHRIAKHALDPFGLELYPRFSEEAKRYFYIPHRRKERGVGGIFFDHYNTGNWERDVQLWKAVGDTFLQAILPIYNKRVHTPFTPIEKEMQHRLRAHYAEFNLVYDRGTQFGLLSGGNPEAILCSMPPLVRW